MRAAHVAAAAALLVLASMAPIASAADVTTLKELQDALAGTDETITIKKDITWAPGVKDRLLVLRNVSIVGDCAERDNRRCRLNIDARKRTCYKAKDSSCTESTQDVTDGYKDAVGVERHLYINSDTPKTDPLYVSLRKLIFSGAVMWNPGKSVDNGTPRDYHDYKGIIYPPYGVGGSIYASITVLTVDEVTFLNNTAGTGSAIAAYGCPKVTITNSIFQDNVIERGGMTGEARTSYQDGGAVVLVNVKDFTVKDSTFLDNLDSSPAMAGNASGNVIIGSSSVGVIQGNEFKTTAVGSYDIRALGESTTEIKGNTFKATEKTILVEASSLTNHYTVGKITLGTNTPELVCEQPSSTGVLLTFDTANPGSNKQCSDASGGSTPSPSTPEGEGDYIPVDAASSLPTMLALTLLAAAVAMV